jgi:hypothetical protein
LVVRNNFLLSFDSDALMFYLSPSAPSQLPFLPPSGLAHLCSFWALNLF